MKSIALLSAILSLFLMSCSSVRVAADYDKKVDFSPYKTYAYFKPGIDKVEISDLDKKRILNAIDQEMVTKGFVKSDSPDLLVNINPKAEKVVNVNQFYSGYGYRWGWNPYWGNTYTTTSTEGILTIDFIDAKNKELIWQGVGRGTITDNIDKRDEMVHDFVSKILAQYPPEVK